MMMIHYLKNKGIEKINTPLFNPQDLYDSNKINSIIRNNYNNIKVDYEFENVDYYRLEELLNFSSQHLIKHLTFIKIQL